MTRPRSDLWTIYKMGGLPSAVHSVFRGAQTAQQMAFLRQTMKQQRHHRALDVLLSDMDVVVFDLETTGFMAHHGDEIIACGAVVVRGLRVIEEESFFSLCKPERAIPEHIQTLTGIRQDDTNDAPPVMDVLQSFFSFVGQRTLVAHASAHDKSFLNDALWRTSRVHMTHRILDTMLIEKWLYPHEDDYSLDAACVRNDVPLLRRHHAHDDARMTADVFVRHVLIARERNVHTLGDLYAHLSISY